MTTKQTADRPRLYRCAVGTPKQMFDPSKPGGMAEQAGKYATITQAIAAGRKFLETFIPHCKTFDHDGELNIDTTSRQLDEVFAIRSEHLIFDTVIDTAYNVTVRIELWRDDVEYIAPTPLVGQRKSVKLPRPVKRKVV